MFSLLRIWFTALYHFTCSTQENLWPVLMYSSIFIYGFSLFAHVVWGARAHTYQRRSFLHYTVASTHRHTITQFLVRASRSIVALLFLSSFFFLRFVGECIRTRFAAVVRVATCIGVSAARFYTLEPKNIVIAYRPAKASSSHNNLTATEWTAHTRLSFLRKFERARDQNFIVRAHYHHYHHHHHHHQRQRIFV